MESVIEIRKANYRLGKSRRKVSDETVGPLPIRKRFLRCRTNEVIKNPLSWIWTGLCIPVPN